MIEPEQINEACSKYTKQSGVEVTRNAQELLRVLLNGIAVDPHPSWRIAKTPKNLEAICERHYERLPAYLSAVTRRIKTSEAYRRGLVKQPLKITTFDLAHSAEWLLDAFCDVDCD